MKTNKITKIIIITLMICITVGCGSSEQEKASHGKLVSNKTNCIEYDNDAKCIKNAMIVQYEIEENLTNKLTVDQNYYNIEKIVKEENLDSIDEIQYLANGKLSNGYDGKIISFTVPKDLFEKIKNDTIVPNQLDQYVSDLWIVNSLK